ncbi:hypothetical protein ACFVHI_10150 [Kitasatospora sp. NPDC127121]|uniref:hypothetical protein n=1 Tax=Kitasatospora sp. NPDC127121 TaxID=3345371 RepID=UPI00362B7CD2
MKSADTEFIGGPLDGRILPIPLGPMFGVPKTYKVPVPAHGDSPARTLVYVRSKQVRGISWHWRYEFDEAATARASG